MPHAPLVFLAGLSCKAAAVHGKRLLPITQITLGEQVLLWVWGRAEHRLAPPPHAARAASGRFSTAPLRIGRIEEECEREALVTLGSPSSSRLGSGITCTEVLGEQCDRERGAPGALRSPRLSRAGPSSPGARLPYQRPALPPAHCEADKRSSAAVEADEYSSAPEAQPAAHQNPDPAGSQDGGCAVRYGLVEAQARGMLCQERGRRGELPLAAFDPGAILHVGLVPLRGAACVGAAARDVRQVQALWACCAQDATLGCAGG